MRAFVVRSCLRVQNASKNVCLFDAKTPRSIMSKRANLRPKRNLLSLINPHHGTNLELENFVDTGKSVFEFFGSKHTSSPCALASKKYRIFHHRIRFFGGSQLGCFDTKWANNCIHAATNQSNSQFQLCELYGFIRKPVLLVMIMVMMELMIMIFMSCESQLSN